MKQLVLCSLLAVSALVGRADIIFGNLASRTNDNGSSASITGSNGAGRAIGFTMGNDSYDISNITLRLSFVAENALDVPLVSIWTSDGTKPVTQVGGAFTNPVFGTTSGNFTFTPAASITLESDEKYFLVVQAGSSTANFVWLNGSPTIAPTGVAGTAISRFGTSSTGNATLFNQTSSNFFWFQINGTVSAIPEPSTYATLIGGLSLGWVVLRRRRP
ncbi:MAG: hypothetical protein K0R17_3120 [Rariglobus sp.]|jgi:hypothetical protein|nr:hypothetical protein [Rariglobus sp.]